MFAEGNVFLGDTPTNERIDLATVLRHAREQESAANTKARHTNPGPVVLHPGPRFW